MNELAIVNAESMLSRATTPQETKELETLSKVARAWAKETGDYETVVKATKLYILSRRKTTELIQPFIQHGGQGHHTVTLGDYGLTKQQWHKRVRELEFTTERIDEYFDECIEKRWEPSLFGLTKSKSSFVVHQDWCNTKLTCNCGAVKTEFDENGVI